MAAIQIEIESQNPFALIPLIAKGIGHFPVFITPFYFIQKLSVQLICPFIERSKNLLFNFLSYLYILDINPLSDE
jgi:hypothetical protein